MRSFAWLAVAVMLAIPATAGSQSAKAPVADTVYRDGFVYTVDGVRSRAQAFAVKDGKFIAVGTNDDMKAVTGSEHQGPQAQAARW